MSFDDDEGVGSVQLADARLLFFHCAAIADGTRTIAVGTPVKLEIEPGHRGQWEARRVTPR